MKRSPTVHSSSGPHPGVATPPSASKRVRFQDGTEPKRPCVRRGGRGFELWRVGVDGEKLDDKPRIACDVDTRVLELGRTAFVNENDVGKHITRVSRVHFRIVQGEHHEDDQPIYRLEDLASNSTFVNRVKVGKGKMCELGHNDIITVLFDENGGPLLQYRFIVLREEAEEDGVEDPDGPREVSDDEGDDPMSEDDNEAIVTGMLATAARSPDETWFRRNVLSISAGVVLLAGALAANFDVIHF